MQLVRLLISVLFVFCVSISSICIILAFQISNAFLLKDNIHFRQLFL